MWDHVLGAMEQCARAGCQREIVLAYPAPTGADMMVWRPNGQGFRYDREDCPARNGERCTPYEPEAG